MCCHFQNVWVVTKVGILGTLMNCKTIEVVCDACFNFGVVGSNVLFALSIVNHRLLVVFIQRHANENGASLEIRIPCFAHNFILKISVWKLSSPDFGEEKMQFGCNINMPASSLDNIVEFDGFVKQIVSTFCLNSLKLIRHPN